MSPLPTVTVRQLSGGQWVSKQRHERPALRTTIPLRFRAATARVRSC
jgi:hypothetical protein